MIYTLSYVFLNLQIHETEHSLCFALMLVEYETSSLRILRSRTVKAIVYTLKFGSNSIF